MLFNSLHFLIFFPVVTCAFFALRGRARWTLLLLASSYFYMALVPAYILVLALLILIDYGAALAMDRADGAARRWWLIGSLAANLGVLFFFKYLNFALLQLSAVLGMGSGGLAWSGLALALPVGLSFHTFQSMSYTVEVYRRRQAPERNLTVYALYVLFYPQLVAGPIERPQHMLPQLHALRATEFDAERASSGLRLMLWGLLKKVVVADGLAAIVDRVYANVGQADSVALLVGAYAFSIQIYCDFSGYTDIARGAARVMGVELMRNFERPYEATSVGEFWRRWHISLSTWFRDYLYFPLGGNRGGLLLTMRNVGVVFLVSGLWHGANWTYVAWGALHGALVVAELLWRRVRGDTGPASATGRFLGWFLTFHAVTVAWVLFRAPSLSVAAEYMSRLLAGRGFTTLRGHNLGSTLELVLAFGAAAALLTLESMERKFGFARRLSAAPRFTRWTLYYVGVFALLVAASGAPQQFIYFQF